MVPQSNRSTGNKLVGLRMLLVGGSVVIFSVKKPFVLHSNRSAIDFHVILPLMLWHMSGALFFKYRCGCCRKYFRTCHRESPERKLGRENKEVEGPKSQK